MDKDLKAKLDEAIAATWSRYLKRSETVSIDAKSASNDTESASIDTDSRSQKLFESTKHRLEKQGAWTDVQAGIANDDITGTFQRKLDKLERDAVEARQLPLPGFEFLPRRIGRRSLADPETKVKHFLAHVKRLKASDEKLTLAHKKQFELAERFEKSLAITTGMSLGEAIKRLDQKPGLALVKGANA